MTILELDVEGLGRELCNWARWGEDDQLGTLRTEARLTTAPSVPARPRVCPVQDDIVRPNLAPKICEKYELFTRLHINRRCCAIGNCCAETLSHGTCTDARNVLCAALACAVEEQLIRQNPAATMHLSKRSGQRRTKRKRRPWTVDEARRFLESAREDNDPYYAAYVHILVLAMRKGEILGLPWDLVGFDTDDLHVGEQLQRVGRQLLRREVKTEASEAPLPLPDLCSTALKLRKRQQDADHERAGRNWTETGLVFTTRYGTPIEPRNFNRSFDRRITKAGVPRITVHDARRTCGSLLAALDMHPRVIMVILRYARFSITMEIYTEVPTRATRDALRKLSRWLDQAHDNPDAATGTPDDSQPVAAALCCCTQDQKSPVLPGPGL